jgi:hypothetical protein
MKTMDGYEEKMKKNYTCVCMILINCRHHRHHRQNSIEKQSAYIMVFESSIRKIKIKIKLFSSK